MFIKKIRHSETARHTLWMLLAQSLRVIMQAVYFIIIARSLGVSQYGAFVGAASLVSIVFPFSALGSGDLLVKNVSRDPSLFRVYWGNTLLATFVSGLVLVALISLVAPFILPRTIPLALVVIIAIGDLVFFRAATSACQAFQAVLQLDKTAILNILPNFLRAAGAILFVNFFTSPNVLEWAYIYATASAIGAVIAVLMVSYHLGTPRFSLARMRSEIAEGSYFSISLSAQSIYNDIDKTMLARLSTLEATGIYAAAYRIIDVAFVPVRSLLAATYAKFFQYGVTGISGALVLSRRMLPFSGGMGLLAALGLFLGAPVVPLLLGNDYASSVDAIRWLAPIPLIKSIQYFGADTLTGAGFQKLRSIAQVFTAIFNILINFWLIPKYSWLGAAWASLLSDCSLMIALWLIVFYVYCKQIKK
jgi:O-antigen/teichoic acid export membrane protein